MAPSTSARRRSLAGAGLVLAAALTLTACGQERAVDTAAGGGAGDGATTSASTQASAGASTSASDGATASASDGATASASPTAPGASPYVEPGAGDGAPHYNENNAYRQSGEMSPEHAKDAEREAERVRPVLKRLWEQGKWDPSAVRAALLRLGYEEERVTKDGKLLGGTLTVREMYPRYRDGDYVTPEGAMVGLRVHKDACVTAFVQKSNFGVQANGPYLETGCFEPPVGH
ncbi:hypothetical protein [Streptomyces sp. HD]|uniref:hypothetical protein n=1 Tax=Streptomyces sp. HD TaxID=3020892 RepID=UPI00232B62A4|nr:hypothetical protein [Streptomyces sp. HD]MDC0772384.1 hypothetical protein [Streptomyces sp. HD]